MIKIYFPKKSCEFGKPFIYFGLYEYQPNIDFKDLEWILAHYKLKYIHTILEYKCYKLIKK